MDLVKSVGDKADVHIMVLDGRYWPIADINSMSANGQKRTLDGMRFEALLSALRQGHLEVSGVSL